MSSVKCPFRFGRNVLKIPDSLSPTPGIELWEAVAYHNKACMGLYTWMKKKYQEYIDDSCWKKM